MVFYEYYLCKSVLGKHVGDERKLFFSIADIFFIPECAREKLYLLAESDKASEINTKDDFMRRQRVMEYKQAAGIGDECDDRVEEVVLIKGAAINKACDLKIINQSETSQNSLYSNLALFADSGVVVAMRIMGILRCEGIFVDKNERIGLSYLKKAADWNDTASILAIIHYTDVRREYNLSRLYMLVKDTPFYEIYQKAAEKYNLFNLDEIRETKLICSAFAAGVLKYDLYDRKYARVIYSKAIAMSYKERAVFNVAHEYISAISDLPLKIMQSPTKQLNLSALDGMTLQRRDEKTKIKFSLNYLRLCDATAYRPICLCSDSKYLLKMYAQALRTKVEGVHVENIDISALSSYDLEPTSNNIFIRSANEDKENIYLLNFYGDLQAGYFDCIKGFLQTETRAKFHLNSPNVNINLSAIVPICLCDTNNMPQLKKYCDVIELAPISAEEFPIAIDDIIASKRVNFNLPELDLTDGGLKLFEGKSVDSVEKCINDAVTWLILNEREPHLTEESIAPCLEKYTKNQVGFGFVGSGK
jgi:hypothetical protein